MMMIMRRKQFIETSHYWLHADIVVFGIKVQFNFCFVMIMAFSLLDKSIEISNHFQYAVKLLGRFL